MKNEKYNSPLLVEEIEGAYEVEDVEGIEGVEGVLSLRL
jgi:hypothetical protein